MYARFFIGNQILYKIQQTKSFEKEILDIGVYDNYIYSHKFQVQITNFYLIFCFIHSCKLFYGLILNII